MIIGAFVFGAEVDATPVDWSAIGVIELLIAVAGVMLVFAWTIMWAFSTHPGPSDDAPAPTSTSTL